MAALLPFCTRLMFIFRLLLLLFAVLASVTSAWSAEPPGERDAFRVCADPNNLPFSNRQQQGFENKLAALLAQEFHRELQYTWWPQRRGFLRNTLDAGVCDVVMGVPAGFGPVLTTQPYYRSTYVFVHPQKAAYRIASFDAPELRQLKIGVHLIGDDYMNSPPAHVLAAKGIVNNVVGYSVFGNYAEDSPPGKIIRAVADEEIDVAIVWGPIAGYFAKQQTLPLMLTPVPTEENSPTLPLSYSIALGVRRQDEALKTRLNDMLQRKATDIRTLLAEYGVPLLLQ
ncbi:MAG: quinoprotein dehydrogenase-associated putative ABC transporter substrate-binding protein [Deltaproteobacteria bacterium]|nr:quinoprotein dehydrogenase-associated putative ABC transporter substrate-binding protein [Deltaproteobacteria bacterium]